jgi:hypothetical protein
MEKIIHLFITKLNRQYYNNFTVKEGPKLKIIFLFFYLSKRVQNFTVKEGPKLMIIFLFVKEGPKLKIILLSKRVQN